MEDNDNRRRLYDNLYKEFQLPEYNQFSEDMKDETKRKRLWENVGKEYQLPDFDKFSKDIGYEVQTTQQGNQNAQNAKKPQQTAQSSHVEEGRGLSSDNGYSKQKTAFDKAAEQAWNKLAHKGGIRWTIKGHPEVKMVAVTDDLVKKFPQLEQSRGYQVLFNMSTGTPIMQNIDDKGNIITPDEASEQYTKILTNQDFDYVPKQEPAAVQIGSVVNTALSTKGGWLDRAVQKAMEESYGKDWKNRKYVSDGKEISSSEIYAKAKQGIYDNINGVLGDIRKSLLFSTDEQRRQTVDELYQKGYLKEDFLPKANALHYISNVDKGEQVEELRQRKLKLQVQREMVMDKLNQIPQPDHAENMAEFYARRANDGSELYASDLRKIDKQIAQYDAVIDELEGRNNLKSEWGHAVQTSGITDIGAWDFGITDLKDAMMMYPLARKMQNGENITQDDFMSLKLLAQANEADAVENAVMPSSYNMFKGSLQSVPFTVQFGAGKTFAEGAASVVNKAATRAVKGAILKAGSKKALRAAEKVAEKAAESKILKFCGMLGKDFEKAFVMENTTGAATTGAEILNRHIGTVTESDDGFKMEGESLPTAIIKGEISQNIESQTEFLGEHFPSSLKFIRGMAHTKVGSAMGLRNLAAWLTKVSRTEFATTLKSYATRAGINGVFGEYLEEVAGTAENALLVGDQKFSDLLDVKQQEEVAGSVVLSCLGMGIFGTAIYSGQRGLNMPTYYRLQHLQNKWDNTGLDLFTGDEWAKLKDRIDNTPNEGMKFVMADILEADNMTEEQARAAFNYARCSLTLRGMNIGAMKAAQLGLTDDRHIEQDNAYVEGRQAKDEDKHDIQIEFEDRSHELAEKLGISEQQLDNMSDEDLESLTGKDDQLDNLIYDYQTSHAKYQGVVDNADDEIDKAAQEAARQTDMATDKSRGTVRNATIKAAKGEEDYGVYIVSGNVATNEDGSINVSESDDMILYYDPKSGKIEHCDAMRLASLGEEVNAEETRNQAIADAKEKAIRQQAGIIDGTVGEGTSFTITDAEGNEHTYEVLADNGDGSAMITMDGNVQDTPVSLQDLQNLKDAEEAKRLEAAKMQRQQYEEEREKQNAPVEDNLDYADIINTNGNVEIAEVVDEEGNAMFPDAEEVFFVQNQGNRAKVMVLDSEGNLQPKLVKKSSVRTLGTMSVDEYRQGRQQALKEAENASEPSLVDETETSNNVVPTGNITTDNTTTNETQLGNEAEVTTSNETQNISNEQENTPKITLEDGTEVPMLEDGNPDFSQLTAGQVAELYDSQFGEDAGQIITNNVNRSKKALDKANAMTVSGGSFVEQKASKEAKDKAIAEAQAKYDSAKAIEDAYNERMLAKEEDTPEGRQNLIEKARRKFNRMKGSVKDNAQAIAQLYDETVGALLHRLYDSTGIDVFDDTANTVDEYVASSIAPYSLNYEGTETSKGVKQETGLSRSDFAKTGLLAKEGKGKTIGQLANDLWRDRPSNLENITDQDVRNAIIDLITSGQTAFGLKNHIQNLRIAEAENILEQQKRQADELAHAEKQKEEESQSTEMVDNNAKESSNTEATPADAQEEDKLADMPFEAPSPDEDAPFSAKDKAKDPLEVWNNMTDEEKAAYIEKNRVKDTRLVDDVVGKKLRKAIEKIAGMMGATIQWQRTDMIRNGWFNPNTKTIYLALDSSVLWGVHFVFGHEMTHDIKTKSPAMYEELKGLVKEKYGEEKFEAMTNKNEKRYADVGKTDNDRSYYEEETVADAIGATIRDLNLTRSLALKMSHPLLAKMHDVLLKIKNAFKETPYKEKTNGIIRTIEQVYVKTANGTFESSASEGTNDDENVLYSLRQKPEPEKKGTGYKVFVLGKDGKLYPPMVANPNGAATPVGVWLDADAAPVAGESKTGRPQVKQGGKGTQGGSGKLAYRPGWHLGVIPYAIQFNRKDAEVNKTLFPKNFVFAEVEYAADKDYQDEAHAEGINSNGKYQHSLAGLKHLPTDGYYMYRTNPNPETDPWVITGAMKVNRLLTRAEQADIVRKAGREPQQIQEGDIVTDDVVNSINQEIAAAPKFSVKINENQKPLFGYFQGSIKDLIEATKTTGSNLIKKAISYANDKLITDLKAHGVNITKDYKHTIDNNSINHAMNRHSSEREKLQGQIPITENDLENIGDVIDNYDSIETERNNRGQDVIIYTKQYNDGTTYYIEEVRTGRKELAMQSIRKRKNRRFTDANSQATQISDLSPVSAANIANSSETSKQNGEKFSLRLQNAINETDTEPTEAQKKSGNYKKGHVKFGDYDYTIENPKGSYRSGVDENGKEWKQKMNDTYGYIRGKFGKDGDHLDMFINDKADLDSWNGDVYVVDQVNPDGTFDEHKVMYGYGSLDEAKKAYLSNYEKGWTGLGNITPVSKVGFDKWLDKSNRKLKPFADYADITSKTNMDTAPSSFEEFLEHPAVRYSIRNEKERAAAEDAYNFAQENRPDRYSRYAIVNMEKPGAVPQYLEKKAVADNWRRYYNKLKWGNYKLFDLDKPFEDNVKNLVGKFPETFRKKNDTTLSKINELTADYNKRKEEYDAMSNSIQELLNGLMKQGRSLAEAESVIRDWGLYKEMDSKYQNLMGIRKQLNELRSGKVADGERYSLIGKKGAANLDHEEEVSTRLSERFNESNDDIRYSLKNKDRKQAQLDIILKTNPMLDDYHTGIRKVEDIKTLGESVEEARSEAEKYGYDEWSAYPDITNDMLQNALETGEITIYSSKPIKNGVFVTPSYMQASDYAGGGNVYEKTVPLTDVAWINTDEGQYAKVDGERYSLKEVNDINSKSFKQWFGDWENNPEESSQMLDEEGKPKVFYHNTDALFNTFNPEFNGTNTDAGWLGDGFYFYGDENEGNGYGKHKMAVYLNIRNPYYATSEDVERLSELNSREASKEFREKLEEEGYDGVYYNGDLRQEAVAFYPNQIKSADNNNGDFSTENDDIRYSLKEVNDKFNDRLAQLIENPNQKDRVLHLGRSSQFLIDGGIADAEIELDFDKLMRKSKFGYVHEHPFDAADVKDLPLAIANPISVFVNTNGQNDGQVILTELKKDDRNFIVVIRTESQNRKGGVILKVNKIATLFPKDARGVINWYNLGKATNIDKAKALHFIEALQNHSGTLTSEELSSAAKIVRNFVNPKQNDGNLQKTERYSLRVDRYRDELNQWKKDNNLPKDAERPQLPVREPNESAADFLKRVKEYRKQAALWATAPTYEDHLLVSDTAQGQFNLEMQRKAVLTRIVIQDSMLAIRKAQEAIMKEVGVDKLNPAEDAYTAENRSHGKAKNEFEEYNDEFLQPLRKAYNELMQRLGKSYDNVKVYMIAKHGLERNAYIAFKYALDEDYETNEERMNAYNNYKADMDRLNNDADLEAGRIDFAAWKQRDGFIRTKYAPSYFKFRFDENGMTKDYSGLSALFDADDYEGAAADLVKEVEDANPYYTDELWYATNDATKKILRDSYNAGMMTEDNFNFVSGMYRNYIPLRGWGDTNADQVWNYVGGGKGAFNQVVKEAKGRKSLADDPIAYIENMAESAILMNNRNWVKQHLLLLAQNHRTSLLNVSKAWYIKTKGAQGNEEWIPASPQITEGMTGKQVEAALEAFEQKMEQMKQNGEATQKREHLEINYPQTNGEEREHEVRVMKGGEEYVIYVNGDPQLAQAVNNTRARKVREGLESSISAKVIARTGRYMAAAYTSMSPLFIPSNYMRDLTMTLASTAIREDARYNYLLRRNMLRHWNTFPMVLSYQNGTLREKVRNGSASRVEQMFYDFMMNGGETGFVTSVDVEDLKKKFRNDLKDLNRMAANPKKVGHIIMDSIETLNRAIEDSNRFMVYMTSIQYGRSIEEAVNNAKDVTLNFNRKGTGEHWMQNIRNLYLFINPAIQSLQTLGALAKHHRFKFTTVTTGWLASGLLAPMLNNLLMSFFGGDDDKDKYWQFTKWDRRNNFIMWIPFTKEFVKIPLAQEFRGFYGVGDMIASKLWGGEKAEESWRDYAVDLAGQIVDMLPLDPTGYDGNVLIALMPNVFRPIFELGDNVDFTGKPIFKNSEYNKYDPNFTKAYVGTPDWLVRISKMVNSIDNKYPDVQQNAIDRFGDPRFNLNNPAVVDHLLSSYLGGAYTMGSQILGVATKALNGDDIKMADIPLASKFVSNPDDRPVSKKQGEEFWDMKERHDRAANTLSKLKKKAKVDGDYSTLDIFFGSDEYRQYKEDDKKVKKYEEDRKKEKAQETGEAYRPHKTIADDVYKSHTTPKDDFEDMKMKQLYEKLNSYKIRYEAIDGISGERGDAYYKANKAAIDAIEEIAYDKSQIASIKKGFLSDGQNTYDADGMKDIRELRKRILNVLEKANKAMMNNRK